VNARLQLARQTLLGAALAALAACAVGPDFHRPAAPAGTYASPVSVSAATAADAPSLRYGAPLAADWYRLLGCRALDQWVKLALRNNPDLQSARASVSEARARLRAAAGGAYPNLQGRAFVNRAHFNPGALGLGTQGSAGGNLFAGLLQLSYHIDLFGRLDRDLEARRAAVQYARDQALNTYVGLVNQVVTSAIDLAAAQSSIDATEKLLDAERRRLRLSRLQETVGTIARGETLTAKAQWQGTQATLPGLRQRRAAAAAALAALLGETPSQLQAPALRLADFTIPATLPVSLPAQLVQQRPDVLAAEQRLHETSAEIGVAAAARLPSISLSADYGSLSDRGADFFNAGNALWALGGNIAAPLFDGGKLAAQQDQAEAAYRRASAEYRSTVLEAFSQVATALRALANDGAALQAHEAALQTARQALDLSSRLLSVGTADAQAVLAARQEYRRELLSRVDVEARRFTDLAMLVHALGGGWWNAPRDPLAPEGKPHD